MGIYNTHDISEWTAQGKQQQAINKLKFKKSNMLNQPVKDNTWPSQRISNLHNDTL